jgi:hypothetical protein
LQPIKQQELQAATCANWQVRFERVSVAKACCEQAARQRQGCAWGGRRSEGRGEDGGEKGEGEGRRAGGEVLVSLRSVDDREGRGERGEWEEGVGTEQNIPFISLARRT